MVPSIGFLTTHILDTAKGCPARGVKIEVFQFHDVERHFIKSVITNEDGRTDGPLIGKGDLKKGVYEMVFSIGAYFRSADIKNSIPFVDDVPIRFGISDANQHYHVPLLVSPYAYSTYRGS